MADGAGDGSIRYEFITVGDIDGIGEGRFEGSINSTPVVDGANSGNDDGAEVGSKVGSTVVSYGVSGSNRYSVGFMVTRVVGPGVTGVEVVSARVGDGMGRLV
jgi:hypothetical protein